MKKTIFFLFSVLPLFTMAQKTDYVVQGSIKPLDVPIAKAYVLYKLEGYANYHRDSAFVVNGKFTIKGSLPFPLKAVLFISPNNGIQEFPARLDQREIYLVKGITTIGGADSVKNGSLGGTQENIDFHELNMLMVPFAKEEEALHVEDRRAEGKNIEMAKLALKRKEMEKRMQAVQLSFIKGHYNSLVAMDILPTALDPAYNLSGAKNTFAKFSPQVRGTLSGRIYEKAFQTAIGVMAPDFSSRDMLGKEISLSSYKGRYVLLDFWASWCLPCRAQNPEMVRIYNKFRAKNFNVLGFSLDRGNKGKEMWQKAITMDKLPWDQVSDLNGFNNEPCRTYQITAVPTNFLIDPSGKIIGKNLHGEELERKLEEIYAGSK